MGIASIGLWSFTLSAIFFLVMKYFGILRVEEQAELHGMDISHGEDTEMQPLKEVAH
jgi:ammonia channel protein AmtB